MLVPHTSLLRLAATGALLLSQKSQLASCAALQHRSTATGEDADRVANTAEPLQAQQVPQVPIYISNQASAGHDTASGVTDSPDLCGLGSRLSLAFLLTATPDSLRRTASPDDMLVSPAKCAAEIDRYLTLQIQQTLRAAVRSTISAGTAATAHAALNTAQKLSAAAQTAREALDSYSSPSEHLPDANAAVRYVQQVYDTAWLYHLSSQGPSQAVVPHTVSRAAQDMLLALLALPRGGETSSSSDSSPLTQHHSCAEEDEAEKSVSAWLAFADQVGLPVYRTYPDVAASGDEPSRLRLDLLARTFAEVAGDAVASQGHGHGVTVMEQQTPWIYDMYLEWRRLREGKDCNGEDRRMLDNVFWALHSALPVEVVDAYNMVHLLQQNAAATTTTTTPDDFVKAFEFLMRAGGGSETRYRAFGKANKQLFREPESVCMRGLGMGFLDRIWAWVGDVAGGGEAGGSSERAFCVQWGRRVWDNKDARIPRR